MPRGESVKVSLLICCAAEEIIAAEIVHRIARPTSASSRGRISGGIGE